MKKSLLFIPVLCFFSLKVHSQYFPGARDVGAKDIPGLSRQLKAGNSAHKKADIMLGLGFSYLFKDGAEKTDMDSAFFYAQQAATMSKQINNVPLLQESSLLKAMTFMEKGELPDAKRMLYMVNDSTRIKLQLSLSKHHYFNRTVQDANDHSYMDSTLQYVRPAIKLATEIRHTTLQKEALIWMRTAAKEYTKLRLDENAEKEYLYILKYYTPLSYPTKIYLLTELCDISIRKGNFYKALSYAIQAEKELNNTSTDQDHYFALINFGNIYQYVEKYDKALIYYKKITDDPARYAPVINIYKAALYYCHCLRYLNRNNETFSFIEQLRQKYPPKTNQEKSYYHLNISNAYKELNNFELAEKNMLEAIRFMELSKNSSATFHSYLAALYDRFNYPEKALAEYKIAEKNFTTENDLIKLSTYHWISRIEAKLGNYESAYKYLLKNKTIADSIYVVSKEKHTQELEFQYQTQKKEADLRVKEENIRYLNKNAELMAQEAKYQQTKLNEASLLAGQKETALQLKEKSIEALTVRSKLQQADIDQAAAKRKVTITVIVLLAVIIALLVWLFWTKLRSNKVITNKNGQLQQLLTDKSWLLKEMHHRVKNNLHIVMSLLESQSAYLQDDALAAVKNSQSRIFSMSLIHQKLYQTDDARTIDMAFYIPELICYLRECFNLQRNFHIHMDIDHTSFNVTEAVPLGLIINEAVTNSMKYAFKNNQNGTIHISLKATGINEYELIMADNGIGLSEGFDMDNVTSLGFQLIKGLSDQLEAQLHIANENGLKITLSGISVYKTIKFETMENEVNQQLTA